MKTDTLINLGMFAVIAVAVWYIIQQGRGMFGNFLGDDPLGMVGGDDFNDPDNKPGWLTEYYSWESGNPDVSWYYKLWGGVNDTVDYLYNPVIIWDVMTNPFGLW